MIILLLYRWTSKSCKVLKIHLVPNLLLTFHNMHSSCNQCNNHICDMVTIAVWVRRYPSLSHFSLLSKQHLVPNWNEILTHSSWSVLKHDERPKYDTHYLLHHVDSHKQNGTKSEHTMGFLAKESLLAIQNDVKFIKLIKNSEHLQQN